MSKVPSFNPSFFNHHGLNLQAIFNIAQLPAEIIEHLGSAAQQYRQLILIGHGGTALWTALKSSVTHSAHPVNDFTIELVQRYFAQHQPDAVYEILYPGTQPIGLQALGKLAGWHHASPFMVGINETWGSWFAYRAVMLADTCFEVTVPVQNASPCERCAHHMCVSQCPAAALDSGKFDFNKCMDYRKQPASKCKATCLARVSCPVGSEHRYSIEQINYHYGLSMKTIEQKY